jgi:hypothetical protein
MACLTREARGSAVASSALVSCNLSLSEGGLCRMTIASLLSASTWVSQNIRKSNADRLWDRARRRRRNNVQNNRILPPSANHTLQLRQKRIQKFDSRWWKTIQQHNNRRSKRDRPQSCRFAKAAASLPRIHQTRDTAVSSAFDAAVVPESVVHTASHG